MTSANPEAGIPRKVEREQTIENVPPLPHREQLPVIAAPKIDAETLRIIRQQLEEGKTK
jgi:hypothetical protein